jgi:hypothetical protein
LFCPPQHRTFANQPNQNMKPGILTAILFSMALLTGCKKDPLPHKPTPESGEPNPRVAIKLNQDYLAAANIDSAILVWEINGQVQRAKMHLSNDTLFTETMNLTKGDGRLAVQIFSNIALRFRNLQWEKRVDVALKDKESVNWKAPANYDDAEWNPRVIMVDAPSRFTAIIALRPADPYFLLMNIPPGFKIELERNYTRIPGGAEIVAGGLWKCNTVCTDASGVIENREFFRPLATQIAGREWKMVETGVGLFGSNSTPGPGFYFNHY